MLDSTQPSRDISYGFAAPETKYLWYFMMHKLTKSDNRLPLLQVQATLSPHHEENDSKDNDIFNGTKDIVAAWFQSRFDIAPDIVGEQVVSAKDRHIEVAASDTIWTCRALYPDPKDEKRVWITEVSLKQNPKSPNTVRLSLSQSTIQNPKDKKVPQPFYPDFLGRLAAEYTLNDGSFPLTSHVTTIKNQNEAHKLATFLKNEQHNRHQPAVVVAIPELDASDYESADAVTQFPTAKAVASTIASHAAGATHVFMVPHNLHGILQRELGDTNAVKPGCLRVYPGYHAPDSSFSFKAIAEDVQHNSWKGFIQYLNSRLGKVSCKNGSKPPPIFTQAQGKVKASLPDTDPAESAEEALEKLIDIAGHLNKIEAAKAQGAEQNAEDLGKELKAYIADLQKLQLSDRSGELTSEFRENLDKAQKLRKHFVATNYGITKPYEEKYEALSAWVDEHYGNNIVLTHAVKNAFSDPKTRKYGDVNLVYAVVELLATHYHNMKTTTGKAHQYHQGMFKERLSDLRIEETATFASDISKEGLRDEYTVSVEGKKHLLDRHIKRGGPNRDPEEHLRMYFAWDDKRKRVVIGHATSHKRNSLT